MHENRRQAWLDDVWAKSPTAKGQPGESLVEHTWLVLERLKGLMELRPSLPGQVGVPELWHCLFWSCWLHDYGKVAAGFQRAIRGGPRWNQRHEVLSLAFIDWLDGTFTPLEENWVVAAIAYHHRDPRDLMALYPPPFPGEESDQNELFGGLTEVEDTVLEGLWRWLSECSGSWIEHLGLKGYGIRNLSTVPRSEIAADFSVKARAAISRRLHQARKWFRDSQSSERFPTIAALVLRGHVMTADHTASAHTGQIPVLRTIPLQALLDMWGLEELYPHQRACLNAADSVVLVAPTGSGKTEAALLWAYGQLDRGHLPRLFYTLPYQASMNAMYDRLRKYFGADCVGLEHSRSIMAVYRRFLDEGYGAERAAKEAKTAFELAQLHFHPVRVLSPYQILKGPYRLRGYESLMTDLAGAVFIVDEIHAYEPDRLAGFLATVRYLRERTGARFLVMSATLPSLLLRKVKDAVGPCTVVRAESEVIERFERHRLDVVDGELLAEAAMIGIVADVQRGLSVLVCCNTVIRAQRAYDRLRGLLHDSPVVAVLLHGRFNGRDRLQKELVVQRHSGSRSKTRAPILLVATQVVEVSLDIDFDVLYTDPAPLEALLQRFGRVNRNRRTGSVPVHVFREPSDGCGIYSRELVERCMAVLDAHNDSVLRDDEVEEWLDSIYQGAAAERWEHSYTSAYHEFEASCLAQLCAFDADSRLEELFYQAFDSIDVLPLCFLEEYVRLTDEGWPIEASQLTVSISWRQVHRLRREGRLRKPPKERYPLVVDAQYDPLSGLRLVHGE